MMNNSNEKINSPCISNCCLDEHDICLGCFRHINEITGWHNADNKMREEILKNTEARMNHAIDS